MVNKWIEVSIDLIDRKDEEMGIKSDFFPVKCFLNLGEIVLIREVIDEEINENECHVYLRSGDDFIIKMAYDKMKKILNEQNSNVLSSS